MAVAGSQKKTTFQEESIRLARARKVRGIWRRLNKVLFVFFGTSLIALVIWFERSGHFHIWRDKINETAIKTTSSMGLNLKNVYLSGLHYLREEEVINAINDNGEENLAGEPIFSISLPEMKKKVEAIGWVRKADIERQLPSTLHIAVEERVPAAIWQYEGDLNLIDREGNIISKDGVYSFPELPIIVGEDANLHAISLFSFIDAEPELMNKVSAIIRVGGRRWNVRLNNGIEIKLPEKKADEAWRKLAKMQKEKRLLDRAITGVDLRIEDRVFIEVLPDEENKPHKNGNK